MKKIVTKKFTLRPIETKDAKDLAKNLNNWNVVKYLSQLPFPYELKHAKQFCQRKVKEMKKEKTENYVMAIEVDGEVVGAIGAHGIVAGHKAEMGYWLAEQHWGNGIMSEAVKKFMKHAFSEFKLHRIQAYAYAKNKGSMRVMEKVGMKFEGILKKHAMKDGKFIDCHLYAKVK